MATKSTISINYTTQGGKKGQKSITDINPNASGAQLKEFAESLNALTTNVYGNTNRVDRTPITTDGATIVTPTVKGYYKSRTSTSASNDNGLDFSDLAVDDVNYGARLIIKTDSDATPHVISSPEFAAVQIIKDNETSNYSQAGKDNNDVFNWRTDLPNVYVICLKVAYDENKPMYNYGCFVGDYVIEFPATENFARTTYTITVGNH